MNGEVKRFLAVAEADLKKAQAALDACDKPRAAAHALIAMAVAEVAGHRERRECKHCGRTR